MHARLVDCRPDREAYLAGHLPGAAYLAPESDLTGTEGGGRHPLPGADAFAASAGRAGIGPGTLVVAYDDGSGWAARLWWLLRHYGHDDAGVIDLRTWQGPLGSGEEHIEVGAFKAGVFEPRPRTDDLVFAEDLLPRLNDPSLTLVDARAPERWRGEVELLDKIAGRIPGARNLYFQNAEPPPADLLEADELVVYCGSGVTACVGVLALVQAGRQDTKLYAGSWSDWSSRGLPVETGP